MLQLEYFPVVIEAHRNDLRKIAHPVPGIVAAPLWRRSVGHRIVQVGRWLEGNRPAMAGETLPRLGGSTGTA